jgi:quercetin dioxygenase-like cupin family protein
VEIAFPPGRSVGFDRQRLDGADQHIWVLDGVLEVQLGDEHFRLEPGDCLLTRFDRPIVFSNRTERPVRYAVIVSHGAVKP